METKNKKSYKKTFTEKEKEEYRTQKETEKKHLIDLYHKFVEKHSIQDFIGIVANYKSMHNYSLRNYCLVLAQNEKRQDQNFVGILNSFVNWKKQNIQVLKGSKGYKILVPIFVKNQDNTEQNQDKDKEVLAYFKIGTTFDITQTSEYENYLKEQEQIDKVIMKNAEIDYNTALEFTKNKFPNLKIKEQFNHQETKGIYDPDSKEIILYEKSSHTVLHELSHHLTITVLDLDAKNYAKNEVLAEISAFLLMKQFDENIDYNFKYSNVWSNRITDSFELEEFEQYFKKLTKYLNTLFP